MTIRKAAIVDVINASSECDRTIIVELDIFVVTFLIIEVSVSQSYLVKSTESGTFQIPVSIAFAKNVDAAANFAW